MRRGFCLLICAVVLTAVFMPAALAKTAKDYSGNLVSPEYIDMGKTVVKDWDAFYELLDGHPEVRKVDMFGTNLFGSQVEELTQRYPDIEFGCTLRVGDHIVRTDATVFSTLHSSSSKSHYSKELAGLKFCKNLRALDIGHNRVDDLSFLSGLTELRLLIIACNRIVDITPIADLEHLEYLEIFSNKVEDVKPLVGLKYLAHLNISYNNIGDLTPLYGMTQLKRLWIKKCQSRRNVEPISDENIASLQAALGDCVINATNDPTEGGWREGIYYETFHEYFRSGEYKPFPDSPPENR